MNRGTASPPFSGCRSSSGRERAHKHPPVTLINNAGGGLHRQLSGSASFSTHWEEQKIKNKKLHISSGADTRCLDAVSSHQQSHQSWWCRHVFQRSSGTAACPPVVTAAVCGEQRNKEAGMSGGCITRVWRGGGSQGGGWRWWWGATVCSSDAALRH